MLYNNNGGGLLGWGGFFGIEGFTTLLKNALNYFLLILLGNAIPLFWRRFTKSIT